LSVGAGEGAAAGVACAAAPWQERHVEVEAGWAWIPVPEGRVPIVWHESHGFAFMTPPATSHPVALATLSRKNVGMYSTAPASPGRVWHARQGTDEWTERAALTFAGFIS
jgi:hypothetical protein